MKKLTKKLYTGLDSIEAYGCNCSCSASCSCTCDSGSTEASSEYKGRYADNLRYNYKGTDYKNYH